MLASSCASLCTKWNWLWKDKCWNKFRYNCIHQNDLIDMETLETLTFLWFLHCYLWKNSTLFLINSLLNFRKCCQLHLPAEIKVQTSKEYERCKHRYKLCHIKQTGPSTTWKETCIKFKKYADCRFWANIYKIYWDFRSVRIISL